MISVVTEGELLSMAYQRKWGETKIKKLEKMLEQFLRVPVQSQDLIFAYADIDSYSQAKSVSRRLPKGFTPKNMGKNDLWIAATAVVTESTVLTNDDDFDHLNNVFFPVFSLNKDLK